MREKIIGIILAIFSVIVIFNIQEVMAVGQVYQGVVYDDGGKQHLIYRTLVRPHEGTENSFDYYNEWVHNKASSGDSTWDSYKSDEIIFTRDKIATYNTLPSKAKYSYITYNSNNSVLLLSDTDDIETWMNTVSYTTETTNVVDNYLFNSNEEKDYYTDSDDIYYTGDINRYNDNIIDVGTGSKTYPVIGFVYNNGTGNRALNRQTNVRVKSVVAFKNYRELLYNSSKSAGDRVTTILPNSLYVEDIFVDSSIYEKLLSQANNEVGKKYVYVSAISHTKFDDGTKFYMLTPGSFIHSKSYATKQSVMATYNNWGWDSSTLGETDSGWGSGLNLWDNKLVLPQAVTPTRKIVVNHVYVDENGNKYLINTEDTTTLTANSTNKGVLTKDDSADSESYTLTKSEPNDKFTVKSLNQIDADKDWEINGLEYKLTSKMYKVKDYNVIESNSLEAALNYMNFYTVQTAPKETITAKISNTLFSPATDYTPVPCTVDSSGNVNLTKDSTSIVINIYYEQPMRTVTVKHIACKTLDGGACSDIWFSLAGHGYALIGDTPKDANSIESVKENGKTYEYVEIYKTFKNEESHYFKLTDATLDEYTQQGEGALKDVDGLSYLGYYYDENGSSRTTYGSAYTAHTVNVENGNIDITFKYQIAGDVNPTPPGQCDDEPGNQHEVIYKVETIYKEPPKKYVGGTLTIASIKPIEATCNSIYSVPGNAIDSTDEIYAGVMGIPMYILAGVNVKRLEHTGSDVTINIKMTYGPNKQTWTINVPYYFSYYAVQNILIQKLQLEEIYNTASGYDTASGYNKLSDHERPDIATTFDITKKTIYPDSSYKSSLRLYGLDTTENLSLSDKTNRENWEKYIKTYYKASFGATSDLNRTDVLEENPYDNYENYLYNNGYGYRRTGNLDVYDAIANETYSITFSHQYENNNISDYINTSGLASNYKEIDLDGETTITINLLSETMFDTINYIGANDGKTNEITQSDLDKRRQLVDEAIVVWTEAKDELETTSSAYSIAISNNGGYTYLDVKGASDTCTNACADMHYATGKCLEYGTASDENTEPPCKLYDDTDYCVSNHSCGDSSPQECGWCAYEANLKEPYENYIAAIEPEIIARAEVEAKYADEQDALQDFDEAYYIQENLWDKYKIYDEIQIAKLLGIDLMFDYASGGAVLEGDNNKATLITVKDDAKYLISSTESTTAGCEDSTTECLSDENSALGGHLRYENGNIVADTVILEASRQTLSEDQKYYYTKGIKEVTYIPGMEGESRSFIRKWLKKAYNDDNTFEIPKTVLNGKRILAAIARYDVDKTKDDGTYVNLVGNSSGVVNDNMYYEDENTEIKVDTTDECSNTVTTVTTKENVFIISPAARYTKDYGASEGNSEEFNIYTPLKLESEVKGYEDLIDQITENEDWGKTYAIQANSPFTVSFTTNYDTKYSNDPNDFTSRYRFVYYIKYNFPVTAVMDGENNLGAYDAMRWIGPIKGDSVQATPDINTISGGSITDTLYNYYVIAVAVNTKTSWTNQLLSTIKTSLSDVIEDSPLHENLYNECGDEGGKNISYYADDEGDLVIVNRIYDFRVTDLKDVNWKSVFRNNENASYVNKHSGIAYYAGISKWNTENPLVYNEIVGRSESEIGKNPTRILPLGPFKNTDTSYISAPKMGYSFSFDLKVTGNPQENDVNSGAENESVTIKPRFYYISKDGTKYYPEYSGSNTGIYLFYKNSSGQYVRVGSDNDKYQIQFKPLDGYRALVQTDINNLKDNIVTAGGLTEFTLKYTETTTYSENTAAITYYGEYKLPNSTIAVRVENGTYDINKDQLKDGYIGVVFDIYANDGVHKKDGVGVDHMVTLSYSKNAGGAKNTSQWDYEGYLGITKPKQEYSTSLKLEKGTWTINDDTYNEIKGTVILYDLDNRASNDYN